MTPEEQRDRLIERRERRARLRLVERSEREAALAAAEILMQHLEALVVPPAFATHLETRVRARARNLAPQPGKVIRFPGVQAQRESISGRMASVRHTHEGCALEGDSPGHAGAARTCPGAAGSFPAGPYQAS